MKSLIKSQFDMLKSTNNISRLKYVVARVKAGKVYNSKGDYLCDWNGDDVVFIDDAGLNRLTTSKINSIYNKVKEYFKLDEETPTTNEETPTTNEETPTTNEEAPTTEVKVDEVIAKCKKAIKKGNVKKAKKLLTFLDEDTKAFKKLSKKIEELENGKN